MLLRAVLLSVFVALAATSIVSADSPGLDRGGNGVVLGSKKFPGPTGEGFGHVKPRTIYNGGAVSGLVRKIRWDRWGSEVASGKGRGSAYKPSGGYYPDPVVVRLQAKKLDRCKGSSRPAYTQLLVQFQRRPGGKFGNWFLWSGSKSICKFEY